ncbi:glycosyltransferase family 2 protein [Brucella ciceri]|uniref:glycosyltransferase family 2 protein n=1 Tax=Brucella ciceri TaxID=391287 RepID=UPI001F1306F3|nr:glycosyltransferase family 2 protein [Brucella ciceri]MCH6203445.1 glycosyltransferase family 2 protein [Brucella ciceri]
MKISLIIPVYNEQEAIPTFYEAVKRTLRDYVVEFVFINDGSEDDTENVLDNLAHLDTNVIVLHFSRNFGKEPALFAGLEQSTGDAVIPIDVDLQDPIDVIPRLISKWREGFDIVLAKRADRSSDTYLKRRTAELFYRLHNTISKPAIEPNVGDFRLLSRRIVDETIQLPEKNLFMKGLLSWVGGKTAVIEYSRAPRAVGESKFNAWKLWNLAVEGITSFSTVPLRIWTYIGLFVSAFSLVFSIWTAIKTLVFGNSVEGYTSTFVAILFLGGVQLIGIGVLGEYIGRIYSEVKDRPRYIIKKKLGGDKNA